MNNYLEFIVYNDNKEFDYSALSTLLNTEPTRIKKIGEISPYITRLDGKPVLYKESEWILEINNLDDDLHSLLHYLRLKILPYMNELINFIQRNNLEIIIFYKFTIFNNTVPPLILQKENINFLCQLNANIEFDGYVDE